MSFEETFQNTLESFFESIKTICEKKLAFTLQDHKGDIDRLLKNVIDKLEAEKRAIESEISNELGNKKQDLMPLLEEEMKYFTAAVGADLEKNPTLEMVDRRIEQAKTIKDTVLSWLPLPSWLKKLLGILNEILDLIRILK